MVRSTALEGEDEDWRYHVYFGGVDHNHCSGRNCGQEQSISRLQSTLLQACGHLYVTTLCDRVQVLTVCSVEGTSFFDNFDYFTGYDPSQGFVQWVDEHRSMEQISLVIVATWTGLDLFSEI